MTRVFLAALAVITVFTAGTAQATWPGMGTRSFGWAISGPNAKIFSQTDCLARAEQALIRQGFEVDARSQTIRNAHQQGYTATISCWASRGVIFVAVASGDANDSNDYTRNQLADALITNMATGLQ